MNRQQHLIDILGEECMEVAQRCSKALRFGIEEVQSGQSLNNSERIVYELHDVLALVEMLVDEGVIMYPKNKEAIKLKKLQVEKFLDYSRKIGTLHD